MRCSAAVNCSAFKFTPKFVTFEKKSNYVLFVFIVCLCFFSLDVPILLQDTEDRPFFNSKLFFLYQKQLRIDSYRYLQHTD